MDATERLQQAIVDDDVPRQGEAFEAFADASNATRAVIAAANQRVMDTQQHTVPLAHPIDPPARPRESRMTRLAREEQLPE